MSIYDASMKYQAAGVPLLVIAGKEYGSGSSRDWAAKGTQLLGVKAVIAESFERIHRSNLVNMGVLPLQFKAGDVGGHPRPDRARDLRALAASPAASSRWRDITVTARRGRRRRTRRFMVDAAHRHAGGSRGVPARRDSAVRAAAAGGEEGVGGTNVKRRTPKRRTPQRRPRRRRRQAQDGRPPAPPEAEGQAEPRDAAMNATSFTARSRSERSKSASTSAASRRRSAFPSSSSSRPGSRAATTGR